MQVIAVAAVVELKTASLRVPREHSTAVITPVSTAAVPDPLQCDAQEKVRKRDALLIMDRLHSKMLTSIFSIRKPVRLDYIKDIYFTKEPLNRTTLNMNRATLNIDTSGKSENQTDHAM